MFMPHFLFLQETRKEHYSDKSETLGLFIFLFFHVTLSLFSFHFLFYFVNVYIFITIWDGEHSSLFLGWRINISKECREVFPWEIYNFFPKSTNLILLWFLLSFNFKFNQIPPISGENRDGAGLSGVAGFSGGSK